VLTALCSGLAYVTIHVLGGQGPSAPFFEAVLRFWVGEVVGLIVVLPLVLKHPALVLKRQLLSIPFYGWYARKAGMIAIDREGHASALRRMVAAGKARLAEGRPIAIFPEGTRKKPGAAPDYKPGVAALYGMLDVACVPFALNSGVYWAGPLRKPGRIVIEFLPAIPPGLKRRDFMAALEGSVESATARLIAEAGTR
jgi:1-acyl-sn-glycerol-3-phosphate acyltransferase